MKATLLVPAYNPDKHLLDLIKEIRAHSPSMQILVVDDGSAPAANCIFDQLKLVYGCILCRHLENCGKGAALKTGIGHLLRCAPDCLGVVTADADGQHRAVDILKLMRAMQRHPGCLVLGTRRFDGQQVPFRSRWGNRITSGVFRGVTGTACADTQTGLRGIPAAYARFALAVPGERFEYEMNLLLSAARAGIPFWAEPVGTVYLDRNHSSHFRTVRDSARIYGVVLRHLCRALLPGSEKRGGPAAGMAGMPNGDDEKKAV